MSGKQQGRGGRGRRGRSGDYGEYPKRRQGLRQLMGKHEQGQERRVQRQ